MKEKYTLADKRHFIENNRDNQIIKDILDNKTTIQEHIESFYDISLSYGTRQNDYCLRNVNSRKTGKFPTNLLKIIEPFSGGERLNPEFLGYDLVRKEISVATREGLCFIPAIFALIGGFAYATASTLSMVDATSNYNPKKAIALGAVVGLSGLLSLIKLASNSRKRWKTSESKEFGKLKESVRCMDNFIKKYKIYEMLK